MDKVISFKEWYRNRGFKLIFASEESSESGNKNNKQSDETAKKKEN